MSAGAGVESWMVVSKFGRQFHAEAVTGIADVEASEWPNESQPQSFYLTYGWLKSQERTAVPEPRYLVLRCARDGRILAAMPCYITTAADQVRFDNCPRMLLDVRHPRDLTAHLSSDEFAEFTYVNAVAQEAGVATYPALVATAANAAMFGYAASTASQDDRNDIESALASAFEQLAESMGCATRSFWYVRAGQFPALAERLAEHGYERTLINVDSRLAVTWGCMADYIASLPRAQRFNVRRELRDFRSAGYRVRVSSAVALNPELAVKYAALQRRYGHSVDIDAILESYRDLREHIGDVLRVFVAESDTELLGFVLAVHHEDVLYTRHAGFDRADGPRSNFVYFNTLFYSMIEYAIEHAVARIEYGTESYDAKRRRGASMTALESFVKTTTADAGALANYLRYFERGVRSYLAAHGARFGN